MLPVGSLSGALAEQPLSEVTAASARTQIAASTMRERERFMESTILSVYKTLGVGKMFPSAAKKAQEKDGFPQDTHRFSTKFSTF